MDERPFRSVYWAQDHGLVLSGSADETATHELRSALLAAVQSDPSRELTVDLSDVDFLPSIALGVIVGTRKDGHRVRVHADEGTIAFRILTMTGLLGSPDQQVI